MAQKLIFHIFLYLSGLKEEKLILTHLIDTIIKFVTEILKELQLNYFHVKLIKLLAQLSLYTLSKLVSEHVLLQSRSHESLAISGEISFVIIFSVSLEILGLFIERQIFLLFTLFCISFASRAHTFLSAASSLHKSFLRVVAAVVMVIR